MQVSRRRFIQGLAAAPLAMSLPRPAAATTLMVRYDIASTEGARMLAIYADAVRRMAELGGTDPLSWTWQWYTHFVNGKADEITRLFGDATGARRSLAEETWSTCQSHAGQNSNHFLPWHRMFVYYLEQIVRQVSGHPDFTLPYWNYTSSDPARRGVVPVQFRMPGDPVYGVLYRAERTALANSGEPIHRDQPADVMDVSDALSQASYSPADSVQGFCRAIDSGIHGRIHVLVGNTKGMGTVPYAGNDPLFWVHHANIDRLWASWNRNGGVNPSDPALAPWLDTHFAMADADGQRVYRPLKDFLSTVALQYGYDQYLPKPGQTSTSPIGSGKTTWRNQVGDLELPDPRASRTPPPDSRLAMRSRRVAAATSTATLGSTKTQVVLRATGDEAKARVLGLDATRRKRSYLVLKNLHAWRQPGVLYHLYVATMHGGPLDRAHYAGNINFFDAEFHDHGRGHVRQGTALGENFYSFDVTPILERIAASGGSPDGLQVVFVPAGRPDAQARPMVASIDLVQQ